MEKLVNGIHRFQANIFRPNREFYEKLADGQRPDTLFITCSDSRMVPDLITQANPGELFVMRNVGNIVPSYGPSAGAEAAAIEYAVKALKVKDIVICGHTGCGAVHGLLHESDLTGLPRVKEWLCHAHACREVVHSSYPHLTGDAQWKVAVEENVLCQIENLRTHPAVAAGLAAGDLKLHGWVYKISTGEVFSYNPVVGQYEPLTNDSGEPVVSPSVSRSPRVHRPRLSAGGGNGPNHYTIAGS